MTSAVRVDVALTLAKKAKFVFVWKVVVELNIDAPNLKKNTLVGAVVV